MPKARHGNERRSTSILTQIEEYNQAFRIRLCISRPRARDDDQRENCQTCGRHYDGRQGEVSRRIRLTC
eukprot:11170178-Lingulodinium_polyedra.AAC.1